MNVVLILLRVLVFFLGASFVVYVLVSTIRTFVLPRSAPDRIARIVFLSMRALFNLRVNRASSYKQRDRIMALYAPFSLLAFRRLDVPRSVTRNYGR